MFPVGGLAGAVVMAAALALRSRAARRRGGRSLLDPAPFGLGLVFSLLAVAYLVGTRRAPALLARYGRLAVVTAALALLGAALPRR